MNLRTEEIEQEETKFSRGHEETGKGWGVKVGLEKEKKRNG